MPSSKIVKGARQETWAKFAFQEIGSEDDPRGVPAHSQAGAAPTDADPLEDLEETIRRQLLEAERRAQEIERDAYQKGYEQGRKDGFDFGAKSMRVIQEQMETLLGHMEGLPSQILQDYREWLIRASLSLAKVIVRREVRADAAILAALVDECMESMDRSHEITLVLHPKDKALLEKHGVLARWAGAQEAADGVLHIRTDSEMERGGCRLISAIQEIDATLETRWKDLEARLTSDSHSEAPHEA